MTRDDPIVDAELGPLADARAYLRRAPWFYRSDRTSPKDHPVTAQRTPCQSSEPEIWFAETPEGLEYAKTLCVDCPLRTTCLEGALERREPWGVWGGEIFEQGRVIARKKRPGRPRLDAA